MTEGDHEASGVIVERAHARPLTPSEAAGRLGVKAAMLRRHASAYEEIFGLLPRDERGGRLYPLEALQHLQHAVATYRAGDASSVAEALQRRADGTTPQPSSNPAKLQADDTGQALSLLLTEVQSLAARMDGAGPGDDTSVAQLQQRVIDLLDQVRDLERRNEALRGRIRELEEHLQREQQTRNPLRRLFGT